MHLRKKNQTIHLNIDIEEINSNKSYANVLEAYLWYLHQTGLDQIFLKKDEPHQFVNISFTLNQNLVIRWKKKMGRDEQYQLEPHCYVLGDNLKLGGGLNLGLYAITGILTFDPYYSGLLQFIKEIEKNKMRLLKIQLHSLFPSSPNETSQTEEKKAKQGLKIAEYYPPLHARHMTETNHDEETMYSYTKMKYLSPINLKQLLENSQLSVKDRLLITFLLLKELQTLHKISMIHRDIQPEKHNIGIIHRDIKPENISICEDYSHLYFVDFDSARSGDIATLSSFTPEYASPELLIDDANSNKPDAFLLSDKASDIFQIGLILIELWGGKARSPDWFQGMSFDDLFSDKARPSLDGLFCNLTEENDESLDEIKITIKSMIEEMVEPNFAMRVETVDRALAALSHFVFLPEEVSEPEDEKKPYLNSINHSIQFFISKLECLNFHRLYQLKNQSQQDIHAIIKSVKQQSPLNHEDIYQHAKLVRKQIETLFYLKTKHDALLQIIEILIKINENSDEDLIRLNFHRETLIEMNLAAAGLKNTTIFLQHLEESIEKLSTENFYHFMIKLSIEPFGNANQILKNYIKKSILNYLSASPLDAIGDSIHSIKRIIELFNYFYGSPLGLANHLRFLANNLDKDSPLREYLYTALDTFKQLHPAYSDTKSLSNHHATIFSGSESTTMPDQSSQTEDSICSPNYFKK